MYTPHTYTYVHTHTYTYVHTHTYTYVHTHTYTYVHTHTYTYVHTHTYTYVHTHTYTYVHTHTYTHTYTYVHTHTYTYVHTHTYTYVHTHTYTYVHTHTYTYVHTHIYICAYTHMPQVPVISTLLKSLICLSIHLLLGPRYPMDGILGKQLLILNAAHPNLSPLDPDLSLPSRMLAVYLTGLHVRLRYYFIWLLSKPVTKYGISTTL